MALTTLVTFRVDFHPSTTSVELLGSWDNFNKPYSLQRDTRTGQGHWKGCHTFADITCDGGLTGWSQGRNGGLKMGGKYWYYYRIDGDAEQFNPAEPFTTSCPLLPGQQVNVMDVPFQFKAIDSLHRRRSSSSATSKAFTLDPNRRYLTLQPPSHPALLRRASSISSVDCLRSNSYGSVSNPQVSAFQSRNQIAYSSPFSPKLLHDSTPEQVDIEGLGSSGPLSRYSSIRSAFSRRQEDQGRASQAMSRRESRVSIKRLSRSLHKHRSPSSRSQSPFAPEATVPDSDSASLLGVASQGKAEFSSSERIAEQQEQRICSATSDFTRLMITATESRPTTATRSKRNTLSSIDYQFTNQDINYYTVSSDIKNPPRFDVDCFHNDHEHTHSTTLGKSSQTRASDEDYDRSRNGHHALSSSATSDIVSPTLSSATAQSGYMSPVHLSQPDTPTISEFGEGLLEVRHNRINSGADIIPEDFQNLSSHHSQSEGFAGYSLAEAEHASMLTIRNLPDVKSRSNGEESPYETRNGKDMVQSWNDGSEHRVSAMDEFMSDMGYLGQMIA